MTQAIDGYDTDYMEVALIDLIYKALKKDKPTQIKRISYDGDGKSCELIITLAIGDIVGDYILSSAAIKESFDDPFEDHKEAEAGEASASDGG